MVQSFPASERAIRDTVAAVFRQRSYNDDPLTSLIARALDWIGRVILAPLQAAAGESPVLFWSAIALGGAILGAALARGMYELYRRRYLGAEAPARRTAAHSSRARDAWLLAQELAARGQFTDAAHALYRALIETAARRGEVRLHPSKTAGDYVRELRGRSSVLLAPVREFARVYERVVYGVGSCDLPRYEELRALATPVVRPNG